MPKISLLQVLQLPDKKKWKYLTLKENLSLCYQKNLYVDAVLKVQNKIFRAHWSILCFHSPVLKKAFYSKEIPATGYTITEIKPEGFEILLRYLYTSEISNEVKSDDLVEACYAAQILQMEETGEKMIHHILCRPRPGKKFSGKTIAEVLFWPLLEKCRLLRVGELQEKLLKFAESNFTSVFDREGFVVADIKTIKLVLDRKSRSVPQRYIMESIARWVEANGHLVLLDQYVRELLNYVDFKKLSPKEFYAVASKYDRLLSKKDSLDIMMHLVDPTICPLPKWCQLDDKGWNIPVNKEIELKIQDEVWNNLSSQASQWRKRDFKSQEDLMEKALEWYPLDFKEWIIANRKTQSKTEKFKSIDDICNNLNSTDWRKKSCQSQEDLTKTAKVKNSEKRRKSVDIKCGKTLQENFYQMLKEGLFTDVTLIAKDNTTIPAHSLILALGSKFFADAFYTAIPASRTLRIEETAEDVKDMLRYFYGCGKRNVFGRSLDCILRKTEMALKYLCYPLVKVCNDALLRMTLDPVNFWTLADWVERLSYCRLDSVSLMRYASTSTKQLFEHDSFLKASKGSVVKVLKSDYLSMAEGDILKNVGRWMEKNAKQLPTDSSKKELLENIRFESLVSEQFFAFLQEHEGILPVRDSFLVLEFLFRRREENRLPAWCYRGPLRSVFYDPSTKIGTNVPVPWSGSPEKGKNRFCCSYTITIQDKQPESEIQFLELSLKIKPPDVGQCSSDCTCSVTITTDGWCFPKTFQDLKISNQQRYLLPVHFRLDTSCNRSIKLVMTVDAKHSHKFYSVSKQALELGNMTFLSTSGSMNCLCDAIVDGFTSENVPIPPHLLSENRNAAVTTEKCFKVTPEQKA